MKTKIKLDLSDHIRKVELLTSFYVAQLLLPSFFCLIFVLVHFLNLKFRSKYCGRKDLDEVFSQLRLIIKPSTKDSNSEAINQRTGEKYYPQKCINKIYQNHCFLHIGILHLCRTECCKTENSTIIIMSVQTMTGLGWGLN